MTLAEDLAAPQTLYGSVRMDYPLDPIQSEAIDESWKYYGPILTGASMLGLNPLKMFGKSAIGLRNVNDGVKRTFLTRPQVEKYYNGLIDKYNVDVNSNMADYSNLTKQDIKDMRQKWKFFAKDNYVGKDINIPNYPTSHFPNKNLGKDYLHNLEDYPELLDNMSDSEYRFTTNFNDEADRLYDHMINESKLVDYLMEVIQDKKGNISHSYKMMKNIGKGDKP